jgi:hypothetical protein
MLTSLRRAGAVVALAVSTVTTFGLGGAGVQPAAADVPTVTVTPSQVTDGATVTVTTSGFGSGIHAFLECRSSYPVDHASDVVFDHCRLMSDLSSGIPLPTFEGRVDRAFTVGGPPWGSNPSVVDCATEPGGCIVGVLVVGDNGQQYAAWQPISFTPLLSVEPDRNLDDGDTVTVTASSVPPGTWSVVQCTATIGDPTDPPATDADCGAATDVAFDGGTIGGQVTVHDPLVAVDGTTHACGDRDCVLVLRSADQPAQAVGRISFGPPSIAFTHDEPLGQASVVAVTLAGLPGLSATVRQCASPPSDATCVFATTVSLDPFGGATIPAVRVSTVFRATDGSTVDCSLTPCRLVAESGGTTVESDVLPLPPPASVTLTPSSGLLDGDPITVDVSGLAPGVSHAVYQCTVPGGWSCSPVATAVAGPDGALSTTVAASARVGDAGYCRAQCSISVQSEIGWRDARFAMAEGQVEVAPATGLADGDVVQVAATELQPTYTGRALGPFPTGVAAVAQCAATAADAPSLFAAFDGCGTLTTVPVTVTGSTADVALTVRSTLTTFTGKTVDCTVPGACVVGVYRFDQDGSSAFVAQAVTFA